MIVWTSLLLLAQVGLSLNIDTNRYFIDSQNLIQNPNFLNPTCPYFCRYSNISHWSASIDI